MFFLLALVYLNISQTCVIMSERCWDKHMSERCWDKRERAKNTWCSIQSHNAFSLIEHISVGVCSVGVCWATIVVYRPLCATLCCNDAGIGTVSGTGTGNSTGIVLYSAAWRCALYYYSAAWYDIVGYASVACVEVVRVLRRVCCTWYSCESPMLAPSGQVHVSAQKNITIHEPIDMLTKKTHNIQ